MITHLTHTDSVITIHCSWTLFMKKRQKAFSHILVISIHLWAKTILGWDMLSPVPIFSPSWFPWFPVTKCQSLTNFHISSGLLLNSVKNTKKTQPQNIQGWLSQFILELGQDKRNVTGTWQRKDVAKIYLCYSMCMQEKLYAFTNRRNSHPASQCINSYQYLH